MVAHINMVEKRREREWGMARKEVHIWRWGYWSCHFPMILFNHWVNICAPSTVRHHARCPFWRNVRFEGDNNHFILLFCCTVVSWGWINAPLTLKKRKETWRQTNDEKEGSVPGVQNTGWGAAPGAPLWAAAAWTSAEKKEAPPVHSLGVVPGVQMPLEQQVISREQVFCINLQVKLVENSAASAHFHCLLETNSQQHNLHVLFYLKCSPACH